MRLVQLSVPKGKRQAVVETLDDNGVDYSVADETSGREYVATVTFPLPTAAVEPILEELREVGVDDSGITVVLDVETVISHRFEQLKKQYANNSDTDEAGGITGEDRIAREELEARAEDLVSALPTYVVLTVVSAVIATAGLLLDSPATVVGSMVIAPLIGPSMAASVGTVIDNRTLFRRGVRMQLLGVGVAVLSAAVFGLFVRYLYLVPPGTDILALGEVSERSMPNFLVLAIALGAGVAGILSLMTGVSTALVGVMIAVALIPPAAAVGVGIAFGLPRLAVGAGVLVTVNVLSINLSSLLTLWIEGYRPKSWVYTREARGALIRGVLTLVFAIALVSTFLLGVTYDSYAAATTEEEIRDAVDEELAETQLLLREVTVERTGFVPPLETDRVVVHISVDPDDPVPRVGERLTERIEAVVGAPVTVEVEFVLVQSVERGEESP